jgi:hypothetical protein
MHISQQELLINYLYNIISLSERVMIIIIDIMYLLLLLYKP